MKKLLLLFSFLLAITYSYSQAGDICFLHTATAANISTASSFIDHPALNDNPSAQIVVTHNLGSDGSVTRNDHVTGIWYNTTTGRWAVFNEDLTNMIESASFNIYVAGTEGHINTYTSTAADFKLAIDDALINSNSTAHPIVTNRYPPNNVHNDNNYGFDYVAPTWFLYNEIQSTNIPTNASFNVLLEPALLSHNTSIAFTHQATAANTIFNDGTLVDHPILNNNPEAYFVVTHNYDAAGTTGSDMDVEHTLGTWYSSTNEKWVIYYEVGGATMVDGAAFSVVMPHPAPANDNPSSNIQVSVGAHGSTCTTPTYMTNVGATDSTGMNSLPAPSCGNYLGGDVFYWFVAPPSGQVIISRTNDDWDYLSYSLHAPLWANEIACGSINNGVTDSSIITGLTPGMNIGLRFWEWNNNSFGSEGFCVREHDPSAGIADTIIEGFSMYPNPVEDMLSLTATEAIENVSIYNMLGQEVLQTRPAATQIEIDMSALSVGSYIIKVQAGEQIGSYNLIKQ